MRIHLLLTAVVLLISGSACLHGDTLSFCLELNSGGNPKFSIDNRSDPGWAITLVTADFLAADVVLDTTLADGTGVDPVATATGFLAVGTYGSFSTAVTAAGQLAYNNAGNLSALVSDINTTGVAGRQMTFGFSSGGILPGDGWGFVSDWDQLADDDGPRGADINGTIITVTFASIAALQTTHTFSYTYQNVSGNGFSFPGLASFSVIPEPASAGLAVLLLLPAGLARRRRSLMN